MSKTTDFAILLALCALCSSCQQQSPSSPPAPAFYHWKNTLAASDFEQRVLDSLQCNTLFIKALDIGRNTETGEPALLSRLSVADSICIARRHIALCCFITNEVFLGADAAKTNRLAERLAQPQLWPFWGNPLCTEIQFDCDWTASTRDAYFSFLKKMRRLLPQKFRLNATIRLHQYKFPTRTGVPPTERGTLMLYNTGDLDDPATRNSIFDSTDAARYLHGAPKAYPLPLDVALPLFSWGVVYREGAFWKLLNELNINTLEDSMRFRHVHENTWAVRRNTFENGHFLRPDDHIRLEQIGPETLLKAQKMAQQCALAPDARWLYFHLDSIVLRRFQVMDFNKLP